MPPNRVKRKLPIGASGITERRSLGDRFAPKRIPPRDQGDLAVEDERQVRKTPNPETAYTGPFSGASSSGVFVTASPIGWRPAH